MDRDHWLWRLDARAWLDAAQTELGHAQRHASSRRKSLTHCRRAAGMALNAVLVAQEQRGWSRDRCETIWGRSYVDHVRAAGSVEAVDCFGDSAERVAEAARGLMEVPLVPGEGLVSLRIGASKGVQSALEQCEAILGACEPMLKLPPGPRPS